MRSIEKNIPSFWIARGSYAHDQKYNSYGDIEFTSLGPKIQKEKKRKRRDITP